MRFSKIFLSVVLSLTLIFMLFTNAAAQGDSEDPQVFITFFWREGCSHCANEKPFLEELLNKYQQVELRSFEVGQSENLNYLFDLSGAMGFEATGVPVTVVGEKYWVGYSESVAAEIEEAVNACLPSGCSDPAANFGMGVEQAVETQDEDEEVISVEEPAAQPAAEVEGTAQSDVHADDSGFPLVWIILGAVAIILIVVLGSFRKKDKQKPGRKRH